MTAESEGTQSIRPLLLLVGNLPELSRVRSRAHDVHYWVERSPGRNQFEGDPGDPATYEWTRSARGVTAVVDLTPSARARAAVRALRTVRPDAAVLVLSDDVADIDGEVDGTVARGGHLRDVLRLDVDEELQRIEAERRVYCLRSFAAGTEIVPILMHSDPDPDAVSSALAVATLLGSSPEHTPIVTLEEMRRPENRRMSELLNIRVTSVTEAELQRFDRIITVDMQPGGMQQDGRPRFAVIDHHPHDSNYSAAFSDVRPEYGATATMLTEYLRAAFPHGISETLATALLFGIKTDTGSLTRGVTPADVEAYAYLQERADLSLVRRFERPSYPRDTVRAYGAALADSRCEDGLCAAFLGELRDEQSHVLADLADFCLGIEDVVWVVVGAVVEGDLVLTLRYAGRSSPGAGAVARALAKQGGSGGGHAAMARVNVPGAARERLLGEGGYRGGDAAALHRVVQQAIEEVAGRSSRRESHPAHQA